MARIPSSLLAVVVAVTTMVVPLSAGSVAAAETGSRPATLADADRPGGRAAPFPASHVAVRWTGADDARVEVRGQVDGTWRAWHPAAVAHDLEDDRSGVVSSGLLLADGADRFEARVVAGDARDLEVVAIDAGTGPVGGARAQVSEPAPAPLARPGRVPPPAVVRRSTWGADESLRRGEPPTYAPVTKLVVHHTVTPNDDPDPAATVRAIYAFHAQVREFNDIGYNLLIDAAGRVYEGRFARTYGPDEVATGLDLLGRGVVGAHAEGVNTGSVGIALLGDFTSRLPTPAAMASLTAVLAWAADLHGIDPTAASQYVRADGTSLSFPNVSGHRDTRATECPGDLLYGALPSVRLAVAQTVADSRVVTAGYWLAAGDGRVDNFGEAQPLGDLRGTPLASPVQGLVPTPSGKGYWLLAGDGGIFSFGDAGFVGSTGGLKLNQPVVGMAPTPTGRGYWLVARDGGIFAFGDAVFRGSTGALKLNQPIVGMAASPSGRGYWLVARDGGIFAFGDAVFRGSTGAVKLNQPVVGMAAAPSGNGYWLVARDGGIFAFGVAFGGSIPGLRLPSYGGTVAMRATPSSRGYYVLGGDGGIFAFGDAVFHGARPGLSGPSAATDLALLPVTPSPV